jgi:recombination protein RecT
MTENKDLQVAETRIEKLIARDSIKKRFNEVLGKKAPQFISSVISAYKTNKALGACEPMSVISAALVAASLDLPINPSLAQAYIIPYSGVAQFQLGWKGYVQLALRSGQYETINPVIIYEGQIVKYDRFTGDMEFKDQKSSEKVVGYLLYFKLLNGFKKFFYLTKDEIEAHAKRYSQIYKSGSGLWKTDFNTMALKTVTKNGLAKFGVLSIEMQNAIRKDEGIIDLETGEVQEYPDGQVIEVTQPQTTSSRLSKTIDIEPELTPEEKSKLEELKKQAEIVSKGGVSPYQHAVEEARLSSKPIENEAKSPQSDESALEEGSPKKTAFKRKGYQHKPTPPIESEINSDMDMCKTRQELDAYFKTLGLDAQSKMHPYYASCWKTFKG